MRATLQMFFLPVLAAGALLFAASLAVDAAQASTQSQASTADGSAKSDQASSSQTSSSAPKIDGGVSGIVAPGSVLTIPVTGETSHAVRRHAINAPDNAFPPLTGEPSSNGLKILLPAQMDPGPYYFTLVDEKQTIIPGSIDVEPDKIKLIAVHPATAYRGDASKFDFDVVGENFSLDPRNDDVTIEGQGSIVKNYGKSQADCNGKEACLWVQNDRLLHIVGYRAERHQGVVNVGVRVGNVTAADQKPLVLARLSGTLVFILSAVITALLFWMVSAIVGTGLAKNKVGRRRLRLWQSFILDPETNSYSLSKFQLLIFSATFIFGYLYVLLSRWLVQWQFLLPDVPSTVAGLLGISGGTTVAAAGLTAARGSKGAGLQQPTGADLISTGGVVAPERFQFFVWTIVACGGFIALLVGQDPAKVSTFPDLPNGLLYVMGVSAAGYLGGKAARKPGPVLENIGVRKGTEDKPWPALVVQGQNLASDGRFFVDEQELGFASDEDKAKFPNLPKTLVSATPQMGAADTKFSTQLEIIIATSSIDVTQGDHTFRIVNRDGQFADISFSASQPSITAVYARDQPPAGGNGDAKTLPATDKVITVVIEGTGLAVGSQVDWRAPGASSFATQSPVAGGPGDGSQLWVSLVPGLRTDTPGALNVTTPKGFVASATVQVVKGPDGQSAVVTQPEVSPGASPTQPDAREGAPAPAQGASGATEPGATAPAEGPHP
ncbi:MAG: hypothetical protein JO091_04370 [Acidobacteriaceae bacterium]|nr:hypothetical protein [Acidobacteriaceae bacterium]